MFIGLGFRLTNWLKRGGSSPPSTSQLLIEGGVDSLLIEGSTDIILLEA